ncbi:MAG: carbonic anhydrase [Bryobacteraceae bacterium]
MLTAIDALARLREGNHRFSTDQTATPTLSSAARRIALVAGQEPFAIVLGCSDSRVPAELVFDQSFGDLFVIRVAGNVVAPSQVGSVEFAASRFGTRLVVVMGHSRCGAITATLEELQGLVNNQSKNLRDIVDRVRPSVETVLAVMRDDDRDALVREAVRANVRASVDHLRHGSELLEQLIRDDGLLVVGAEYSLETGVVEFFENTLANMRDTHNEAESQRVVDGHCAGRISAAAARAGSRHRYGVRRAPDFQAHQRVRSTGVPSDRHGGRA